MKEPCVIQHIGIVVCEIFTNFVVTLRRVASLRSRNVGGHYIMKAFITLDSWLFQKSGSFKNFVKNEVTIDVSGMVTVPHGGLCYYCVFPFGVLYIIRRRLYVTRSTK